MKESRVLKKIEELSQIISSLEKNLKGTNRRMDELSKFLENREFFNRAKTERFTEQAEQLLTSKNLEMIRGRHREILSLLMNEGFHTYEQLSKKLDISQSRARAYITEIKSFGVPLRQIKDPEGYKVGIDAIFVEKILSLKSS